MSHIMHGYNIVVATDLEPGTIIFVAEEPYIRWNWAMLHGREEEAERILDEAGRKKQVALVRHIGDFQP